MSCPSSCENPPESTGAAGVCNNVTGLCICPSGFDGKDIWRAFNDCHVDQRFRNSFIMATFVLNVVALVFSVVILIRLLYDYIKSLLAAEERVISVHHRSHVRRAQKRRIIAQMFLLVVASVAMMPYSCSILFATPSVYRYEVPYALDACLAVFHICVFASYWMSTYVWFNLLPSLPFIAKLYRMKSFVFDKPDLVPRLATANVSIVIFVEFLFTFILPSSFLGDAELRSVFDTIAVVGRMLFCLSLCIPVFFYLQAFATLLEQALYQRKNLEQLELKFIGKGRISLRVIQSSLLILVSIWIFLFIPVVATDYGMRNSYIFYSTAVCAALCIVITTTFNTGIRMAETVDLASAVKSSRPAREGEVQQKNKVSFSHLNTRDVRELLMDDDEVEDGSNQDSV